MILKLNFKLYDCPSALEHAQLEFKQGKTVLDLINMCAALPNMNATAHELRTTNCLVDGLFRMESYVFQGDEKNVLFLKTIEGG